MMESGSKLFLNKFYPEKELKIVDIRQQKDKTVIQMKSISKTCSYPKCSYTTNKYHGMYRRKVQDLPILGKRVQLEISSHEYEYINDDCEVTSLETCLNILLTEENIYYENAFRLQQHYYKEMSRFINKIITVQGGEQD